MGDKKASSKNPTDFFSMMQSMQGMQANMKNWQRMQQMMVQVNNDDQDQPLSNLVVFPNKKRKSLESTASPAASAGQGAALALQDQEVRKEVQSPDVPAPFQVPAAQPLLAAAPADAAQEVDDHALEMKKAFEKRAAMKKPACAPKATPKATVKSAAKAKPKATPKATVNNAAKAKPKAGGKTVAKATLKGASKRPSMIPKGGPTCYYLTGKIHRSDTSTCWRVFRHSSGRCDLKVNWKGSPSTAWDRACSVIEEAAGKGGAK